METRHFPSNDLGICRFCGDGVRALVVTPEGDICTTCHSASPTLGTYIIPDGNIGALEARVAKLNKRAAKLGVAPVVLTRVGSVDTPHICLDGLVSMIELGRPGCPSPICPKAGTVSRKWTVTVDGVTPKLAGWTFVATIEHTPDGNIVRTVPGTGELPIEFRSTKATRCDHCRVERHRNDTFVLHTETPVDTLDFVQVGSTCIKDFLGGVDPQSLASWAEVLAAFGDDLAGAEGDGWDLGGEGDDFFDGETYLTHVAAMVRTSGWLSRTKARENAQFDDGRATYATADRATDNMFPSKEMRAKGLVVAIEPVDEDRALAALAWAENVLHEMDDADLNDYLHNLRAVTKSIAIRPKHAGLFASLLLTAEREGEKAERVATEKVAAKTRVHVGEVGKRETFMGLTVKFTHGFEGGYGLTTIISFRDSDDNALVWFKSGSEGELTPGTVVDLMATVKAHEDGEKFGVQTIITRGKVLRVREED